MIRLKTGDLSPGQIECLLDTLPFEITFVDENDLVRFFNRPLDMVFTRSVDILGHGVLDCHPEKSRAMVGRMLENFRNGGHEAAEFVKQVDGRVMHIRYFAVRDPDGTFLGCLEVAQDITRIKTLEPEGD